MFIQVRTSLGVSLVIVVSSCNGQWRSPPPVSTTETLTDDLQATAPAPASEASLDPLIDCRLNPNAKDDDLPAITFPLPQPPKNIPWTRTTQNETGIGYLGPVQRSMTPETPDYLLVGYANEDWIKQIILPLYNAPEGDVDGWLACGWLMTGNPMEQTVLEPALFYPGYTGFGFIVLAEQAEWLQIRYGGSADNTAWVLRSQLQAGLVPLGYISWQDRYQAMITEHNEWITEERADAAWGYLNFNNAESAPLYASPDSEAEHISPIEPNHSFLPLAIQGDWMRVRVYQPASFCNLEWQGTVEEGWIRWMDAQQGGNQISEPYKGC